jgi:hypothetical protein
LVKDHTTSVEEALRLIAPIFFLLPQVLTVYGVNPIFNQHAKLTMQELQLLHAFTMNLNVSVNDTNVEVKLKRAVQELNKLVHSGLSAEKVEPQRLPFSNEHTYEDVRKILTNKILNNSDLIGLSPLVFTMGVSIIPQGTQGVLP